jgi:chorismate mutase
MKTNEERIKELQEQVLKLIDERNSLKEQIKELKHQLNTKKSKYTLYKLGDGLFPMYVFTKYHTKEYKDNGIVLYEVELTLPQRSTISNNIWRYSDGTKRKRLICIEKDKIEDFLNYIKEIENNE